MFRRITTVVALSAALIVPSSALAQELSSAVPAATDVTKPHKHPHPKPPKPKVKLDVGNLQGGDADILSSVPVDGTVTPFVKGQKVALSVFLDGKEKYTRYLAIGKGPGKSGKFSTSLHIGEDGRYAISAKHIANKKLLGGSSKRVKFGVDFPTPSGCDSSVKLLEKSLRNVGYVPGNGRCLSSPRLQRAILAFRKVNNQTRNTHAGESLLRRAFDGEGGYKAKYPNSGLHVEVPLSKQVLVILDGDKPLETFPVSTGKPSTPTVQGHFTFIRREPGLNSHGMYYSFYFYGGYAVHGYAEVPTYAASHGCVRVPIPDAQHIYDTLQYGESIYVF